MMSKKKFVILYFFVSVFCTSTIYATINPSGFDVLFYCYVPMSGDYISDYLGIANAAAVTTDITATTPVANQQYAYENKIHVLNNHYYSFIDDTLEINFVVRGNSDDLIISVMENATIINNNNNLTFLKLYNGNSVIPPTTHNNTYFMFKNYSNDQMGKISVQFSVPGVYQIKLESAGYAQYVNNTVLNLKMLDLGVNAKNGPVLNNDYITYLGSSAAPIGDLNGDSIRDIAVNVYGINTNCTGVSVLYILFMNADGSIQHTVETNDFMQKNSPMLGHDSKIFRSSITSADDLNGDSIQDIAVASYSGTTTYDVTGTLYILFMNSDGSVQNVVTTHKPISTTFLPLLCNGFGSSITSIGDLNGDSTPDIAVGAYGARNLDRYGDRINDTGALYIMFMNPNGSIKQIIPVYHLNENKENPHSGLGSAVDVVGDLNNDSVPDIVVGSYGHDDNPSNLTRDYGGAYILFMNPDGSIQKIMPITKSTKNGPILDKNDFFGSSIASVGDLNNDDTVDIAVTSHNYNFGTVNPSPLYILFMNSDGSIQKTIQMDSSIQRTSILNLSDDFNNSIIFLGKLYDNSTTSYVTIGTIWDSCGFNISSLTQKVKLGLPVFERFKDAQSRSIADTKIE